MSDEPVRPDAGNAAAVQGDAVPVPTRKVRWFLWPFRDEVAAAVTWTGTVAGLFGLWYAVGQNEPKLTW